MAIATATIVFGAFVSQSRTICTRSEWVKRATSYSIGSERKRTRSGKRERKRKRDYTDVIEKVSYAKISSSSSPQNGCRRSDCRIKRFSSISDTCAAKRLPHASPRSCYERSIWSQFPFPSVSRRPRPTAFFSLPRRSVSLENEIWCIHSPIERSAARGRFSGRCPPLKQLFRFAVACYTFVES